MAIVQHRKLASIANNALGCHSSKHHTSAIPTTYVISWIGDRLTPTAELCRGDGYPLI
jgi:hypothetical protein